MRKEQIVLEPPPGKVQFSGMTAAIRSIAILPLFLASASGAFANAQTRASPACYDAVVKARIHSQIPSIVPDCGSDCIIMTWPWFLDLDVRRTESGDVPRGRLETLAMLHMSYRRDLGSRRWWLRRNTLGGYNALRFDEEGPPPRCAAGSPPEPAYIDPGSGEALRKLREAGERIYRAQ
ncbi:hypothetical protein OMP43_03340 [Sphingomonas sp. CBMAI 2297]|uniref:hypothetical protein n=1 Tax=Sphingomonas sp. CBMAI 2297 TaxID=2991720 RepID=UPI002456E02C|nr:hypothetical protein [Sphingomonas sp. CBMAI 2297]MDH4743049.1 hypothetical protein [Sphingomonas sp. CBMAI 2297]